MSNFLFIFEARGNNYLGGAPWVISLSKGFCISYFYNQRVNMFKPFSFRN